MTLTVIKTHVDDLQKAIETGRQNRIGGSDAGTILGMNPWKSAYTLWAEKCGMVEPNNPDPDNERIRLGHDLEQYVASRWMEFTGKKCQNDNHEYSLKEYPYLVGHIDRRVVGESAGLEIKTTSEFNKTDFRAGDIEPQWYAQCVFYMAVTGMQKWYLAVMQYGKGVYCFEIQRNELEIENLLTACAAFWHQVITRIAPAVDGSDSTTDTLEKRYRASGVIPDDEVDMDPVEDLLNERRSIEESEKRLKEQKQAIDNEIKERLGESIGGWSTNWKVTWKPQKSTRLDSAKLKEELPDVYAKYSKTTESRVLRITQKKEKKQ